MGASQISELLDVDVAVDVAVVGIVVLLSSNSNEADDCCIEPSREFIIVDESLVLWFHAMMVK